MLSCMRVDTLGDSRDASTRVCLRVRGSAEGRAKVLSLLALLLLFYCCFTGVTGTKVPKLTLGRGKAFALIEAEEAAYEEERMPLAARYHFVLIGKGGEVIKSLEAETNTAICFTQVPKLLALLVHKCKC
jgi:hypothetical protein